MQTSNASDPQPLTLNHGESSPYRIALPDIPSPAVEYAAKELQRFFAIATGARLPIDRGRGAAQSPALFLGHEPEALPASLRETAASLGPDGVLVATHGPDVFLFGQNERGAIYAVYEFLERCAGTRFLAWDCTVVPRHARFELPPQRHAHTPPFMYRETLYFNSFEKETALRHRLNGPFCECDADVGGKWMFHPYVHSFAALVPPDKYFAEHPEYFSLINGLRVGNACDAQLCLTNPDVLRIATERVLDWIEEHPEVPIFDVSQNDGYGPCECSECAAVVQEEGSQHGPILRFVNAIADEVARRHPDRWIETLAYAYATRPPARTRPRDNVIIRLCHVGNYFRGFEEDDRDSGFAGYLKEWTRLTPNVFVWHYATNFGHYLAPNPNLVGLARDIQAYARHGVNGLMVQTDYQSPGGELAELRQYLAARLMWDPAQDPAALREEFCRGYYRGSADAVLEFLRLQDAQVDEAEDRPELCGYANWDPTETVSAAFVSRALDILARAQCATTDALVRNRLHKLLLPFRYMQLRYPARYGVAPEAMRGLLAEARNTAETNGITHVREVIVHHSYADPAGESGAPSAPPDSMRQWLDRVEGRLSPPPPPVAFDLYLLLDDARLRDCLVWRADHIVWNGEWTDSIFHHPPAQGYADATYDLTLPAVAPGERLLLVFATGFTAPTSDGVRFSVLIDGQELWSAAQSTLPAIDRELDLTPWADTRVELTLRVDALQNHSFDWAHWVRPRIIHAPA